MITARGMKTRPVSKVSGKNQCATVGLGICFVFIRLLFVSVRQSGLILLTAEKKFVESILKASIFLMLFSDGDLLPNRRTQFDVTT